MRHAPFTCLLAALCSATNSLAHALQDAAGLEPVAENMQELQCVFDKHLPTSPGVFFFSFHFFSFSSGLRCTDC